MSKNRRGGARRLRKQRKERDEIIHPTAETAAIQFDIGDDVIVCDHTSNSFGRHGKIIGTQGMRFRIRLDPPDAREFSEVRVNLHKVRGDA